MKMIKIYVLLPILLMSGLVSAQIGNDPMNNKDSLKFEFKRAEEIIQDFEKPRMKPDQSPVKIQTTGLTYIKKDIKVKTEYVPPKPRVTRPPKEKWDRLENNFLKVGFGRFATPFARLYLNNGRDDDLDLGLDFTHISASNGHVEYAEFREDYGTFKASYYLKKHTVKAHASVFNTNYFYYADTLLTERPDLKDSIRNKFTRIEVEAELLKNYNPEDKDYSVKLRFQDYFDGNKNSELHVSAIPRLDWRINEKFTAGLLGDLTFSNAKFDSIQQTRIFLDFTPQAKFESGRFSATAALKINSYTDSNSTFGAFPIVHASYELMENYLTASAGLSGQMKYNKYYDVVMENRYISQQGNMVPTKEKINIFGQFSGKFASYFTWTVKGYHKKLENQLIYFNAEGGSKFELVYDSLFKESGAELSVIFNKDDKIRAGVKGNIRSFKTSTVSHYYNVPKAKWDFWASYNFADKLIVEAEVYLYGKRTMSIDALGNTITEDAMADVNLFADYRFSKWISVFLELNNILGNTYFRWYNYQERPFDVKAGVSVSF